MPIKNLGTGSYFQFWKINTFFFFNLHFIQTILPLMIMFLMNKLILVNNCLWMFTSYLGWIFEFNWYFFNIFPAACLFWICKTSFRDQIWPEIKCILNSNLKICHLHEEANTKLNVFSESIFLILKAYQVPYMSSTD